MRSVTPFRASKQNDILYPEIVNPRVADVEAIARWMDYAFTLPGGFQFGLAGFIDLIPGLGDVIDALISLYIVGRAVQLGIPQVTLARMVVNVGIESLVGAVPVLGAMFDVVFKANRRNYQLLTSHVSGPRRKTANDWLFLIATGLLALAGIAIPIFIVVEIARHI